jgi:hypothetical protein
MVGAGGSPRQSQKACEDLPLTRKCLASGRAVMIIATAQFGSVMKLHRWTFLPPTASHALLVRQLAPLDAN